MDKHFKYVQKKVDARKSALLLRFTIIIAVFFSSLAVHSAISNPDKAIENVCTMAGTGTLAMASMVTINDVGDYEVAGSAISQEVYLLPLDEINKKAFPSVGPNREVPDIQMLAGKYMHYAEAHSVPTFIANYSKDSGAITVTATNTFTLVIGGFRDDVLNLVENRIGAKFVILFKDCPTGKILGIGNVCKPATLSTAEVKNDGDGRYATLTFTQQTIQLPWTYVGAIVDQDPVTVAANATALAVIADNSQYLISNGTAAAAAIASVTGLTAADKGRIITLIGDGTTYPSTIADGSPFILVDGATWTAARGSTLTLRVLDASTLVEHSRS